MVGSQVVAAWIRDGALLAVRGPSGWRLPIGPLDGELAPSVRDAVREAVRVAVEVGAVRGRVDGVAVVAVDSDLEPVGDVRW
ncbi:MAG: hypothetical protein ABMB14_34360, partial [Myxococcota bacterium]